MKQGRYFFAKRKPVKCPECGSTKIARIEYGNLPGTPELLQGLDDGTIVVGGCCMTGFDASWQCQSCHTEIFHDKLRKVANGRKAAGVSKAT